MKAILSDFANMKRSIIYTDLPIPKPAPDEILIKVKAASVNFADVAALKGEYHAIKKETFIPGFDCAGVVAEVGDDVTRFYVGQNVVGFPNGGAYAEYVAVKESLTYSLHKNISFDTAAAAISVGITAYDLMKNVAQIEEGNTILVHAAAGGVGLTLLQLARLWKARWIVGTVGHKDKEKIAIELGANQIVNYQEKDFEKEIMELTNNNGVDIVFDSIGGYTFEQSMRCVARFGKIVTYGHASGQSGTIKTTDLYVSSRSVLGYSSGARQIYRPEMLRDSAEKIMDFIEKGYLTFPISQRFSLCDANHALEIIKNRKSIGKIILHP